MIGSGLLNGLDWVATTQQILATEKPDAVVAIFVGNYDAPFARAENGVVIEPDTPAFFDAWQARAAQLSAEVHNANASMYWVSPPPISAPPLDRAARLFTGYRALKEDHFLSSGRVLAGAHDGEIAAKTTCGHLRTIRSSDGVHLTDDGARIYGQQIAHDLTVHWGILVAPKPC